MALLVQLIRLEVGKDPEVLGGYPWSGALPNEDTFRTYARECLQGFYDCDDGSLKRKPGHTLAAPEAVRIVGEDGQEIYRYDVRHLLADAKNRNP
jgi:hypothetical protein